MNPLARGLGNAFLDGLWEPEPMYQRGTTVIRARRKWLWVVVEQVLQAYPRPPHDRPRELAAFIEQTEALGRVKARGRRIPPAPTRMADRVRPLVPPIDNETELAHLLGIDVHALTWFADVKGLQRRAAPGPLHHYRYTWRPGRRRRPGWRSGWRRTPKDPC